MVIEDGKFYFIKDELNMKNTYFGKLNKKKKCGIIKISIGT